MVKKYANRRLYNTETSSYITLDNLADMIRAGRDFVVYDAKSGEDITRGVLTQIIVEEESKGTSMLPTAFLRQLIGFYGDSLQGVVPRYLETAMTSFARQQQQLRQAVQQTISPFLPAGVEEMGRQNLAMIERAMSLFNPFHRGTEPLPPAPVTSGADQGAATGGRRWRAGPAASGGRRAAVAACSRTGRRASGAGGGRYAGGGPRAAHAPIPYEQHAETGEPPHVPPAGPIGAAAALAAEPAAGAAIVEAAIHHAVDAVAGHATHAASDFATDSAAKVLADPKPAAPLSTSRRTRTARNKS